MGMSTPVVAAGPAIGSFLICGVWATTFALLEVFSICDRGPTISPKEGLTRPTPPGAAPSSPATGGAPSRQGI